MGEFAEKYENQGLQVFRIASYDDELTALEFERHYRLNGKVTTLLDTDRRFEKRYNPRGWPFCILTNGKGDIVYSDYELVSEKGESFYHQLETVLNTPRPPVKIPNSAIAPNDSRDFFPSLATALNGDVHLVFTRITNGVGDIFYRRYYSAKSKWSDDLAIQEGSGDHWDGTIVIDEEGPIVSFVSDQGTTDNKYEVFVTRPGNPRARVQVTSSPDDAMHPRMCVDGTGTLWLTYYQWHKMRNNSRDKEVYLHHYKSDNWSSAIKVSPDDVPTYEDHTEPFIVPREKGVSVLWAWDFHKPKGYEFKAYCPTIFMRNVTGEAEISPVKLMSLGGVNGAARAVLDSQGKIWNLYTDSYRSLTLSCICEGEADKPVYAGNLADANQLCSPNLLITPNKELLAIWAQYPRQSKNGSWTICWSKRKTTENDEWTKPKTLPLPINCRFPSAAYSSDGKLWMAYIDGEKRVKVKADLKLQ